MARPTQEWQDRVVGLLRAELGELVMRELKRIDKVAYIRFASVYRSFEDVDDFSEMVKEVRPARRRKS